MEGQNFDHRIVLEKVNSLRAKESSNVDGINTRLFVISTRPSVTFISLTTCCLEWRNVFLEQIFDWSDYYNEYFADSSSLFEALKLIASLTELWLAYADFEVSLRQYKKATEVFEKAMGDPIVGKVGRIYLAFAEYCIGRSRPATAQKAYIAGLTAGIESRKDNDQLWRELLKLLHMVNKNTSLTLVQLYDNVAKQLPNPDRLAPLPLSSDVSQEIGMTSIESKEQDAGFYVIDALESKMDVEEPMAMPMDVQQQPMRQHQSVLKAIVEELESVQGLTPEQVVRAYSTRPPMLFVAPHKVSCQIVSFSFCLSAYTCCLLLVRSPWHQAWHN
jgi:hypothetical protein